MNAGDSKLKGLLTPQFWVLASAFMLLALTWAGVDSSKVLTAPRPIAVQIGSTKLPAIQTASQISKSPDCAVTACLALTFDDGPNPLTTPDVLTALEQARVPATFFVIGSRAATQPGLLQRMYQDGDEIGNHSWSHPNLTTLPPNQIAAQVEQTQSAVAAAGVPPPTVFRPPYGAINQSVIANVHLPLVLWNVDPKDWQLLDPAKVTAAVEATAKAGGIVEMHDIYASTVAALPGLLANLKNRFTLVTVSQLLDLQPGDQGIFYGR